MTSGQARFPIAPSASNKFSQAGQCGLWMNSELLPQTARVVDEMAFIQLDAYRGDQPRANRPTAAIQPGARISGRPCIGSWVSYGLGSINQYLPHPSYLSPRLQTGSRSNRFLPDSGAPAFCRENTPVSASAARGTGSFH